MGLSIELILQRFARYFVAALVLSMLSACATPPTASGISDPYEAQNRKVHGFNTALDRALVGPAAEGFGSVPKPARQVIGNLADTLDLPGDIANNLLQLRVADAAQNTLRLAVNLTMGVAGIFDASTAIGLPGKPTDFGETLHVWGANEGAYVELPVLGPSTTRDAVGRLVDVVANPTRLLFTDKDAIAAQVVQFAARLGDRDQYSAMVDAILYESADSYAQARLLYLQNRRFQLNRGKTTTAGDDFIDPYEDPYAQ